MTDTKSLPLHGIRVLDFGRYIAGPFCATLLADMGADVIRVERTDGSEDRYLQPSVPHAPASKGGDGSVFLQLNRNKRGITLNPMTSQGQEIIAKLVKTADVVVANLPPETLKKMTLDYDSLKAVNPRVILTTVSAFGRGGPYSNRVGFDGVAQAMSGNTLMSGSPDAPARAYAPWVDFGTASLCAFGTLAALRERDRSGEGQMVEGALLFTALSFMAGHIIEEHMRSLMRPPAGNRAQHGGPSDVVRVKDGWIVVQVLGGPLFKRFANLIKEPELIDDPRFKDDISRGDNGEILSQKLADWAADKSMSQAAQLLDEARIPMGPLLHPAQVPDNEHVKALNFFRPMPFPGNPKEAIVGQTPVRLHRTTADPRHRAPTLGEHTDAILAEVGYSPDQIKAFRNDRVV